jgi:hypothetical protein
MPENSQSMLRILCILLIGLFHNFDEKKSLLIKILPAKFNEGLCHSSFLLLIKFD